YLERGEFAAAAWTGDRLLAFHPNINDDRPSLLYRTAIAYHLGGSNDSAQTKFTELKDKFPKSTGTVRGENIVLTDSLAQELQTTDTKPHEYAPDSWPMPFGSPDRARVPQVNGFGGAH